MKTTAWMIALFALASILLGLAGCSGGGGGGGGLVGGEGDEPPQFGSLTIQEPGQDELVNESTLRFVAKIPQGSARSARVEIDGVDRTGRVQDLILLGAGIAGKVTSLGDGTHRLRLIVETEAGEQRAGEVRFRVSTGGGTTRVVGRLIDPEGQRPIAGARVFFEEGGPRVTTDSQGRYVIDGAPPGLMRHLVFDPTALRPIDSLGQPYRYPLYKRPLDIRSGARHEPDPCYLPKVYPLVTLAELADQGIFDCGERKFLKSHVLRADEIGVELTIPRNTFVAFREDEDPCTQYLSIAPVDKKRAPSNLPDGVDPSLLITVQPTGMKFLDANGRAQQLPISFPNLDRLADDTELDLFSVDHETGRFVVKGQLEARGDRIVTTAGGLEGGSWHCPCVPGVLCDLITEIGNVADCVETVIFNPRVAVDSGLARESIALPAQVLFDEEVTQTLAYDSARITPTTIVSAGVTIPVRSTVPEMISVTPFIGDVPAGETLYFDTADFPENKTTPLTLPYEVDLGALPEGLWPYRFEITSHYPSSTATTFVTGELPVVRRSQGPFGQGWDLASDARLLTGEGDTLLLLSGSGESLTFEPAPVSFADWTAEGPAGDWQIEEGGYSVLEAKHYQEPAFFVAPESFGPGLYRGTMSVETNSDDDFMGLVLSYRDPIQEQGDAQNELDFVLFDWKQAPQSNGPFEGFSLARVKGTFEEFFPGFFDKSEVPGYELIETRFGEEQGWADQREHAFLLDWQTDRVRIQIDGRTIFDVAGSFPKGRLGFYAFSQSQVRFRLQSSVGGYRGPAGDFSLVTRRPDGGFKRQLPDGAIEHYDAQGQLKRRLDRRRRETQYMRDGNGRLTQIVDVAGGVTTLSYAAGHVTQITDPAGRKTALRYSGENLIEIALPDGATWQYAYDGRGLIQSRLDPEGHRNRHTYDARGRLRRTEYPDGSSYRLRARNPELIDRIASTGTAEEPALPPLPTEATAQVTDPAGGVQLFTRGVVDEDTLLSRWVDAAGRALERELDPRTGLPRVIRRLDDRDRVLSEIEMVWDPNRGRLLQETRSADGPTRVRTFLWHEERAWLESIVTWTGNQKNVRIYRFERDEAGNVCRIVPPAPAAPTEIHYDAERGYLPVWIQDPTGLLTSFEFDEKTHNLTQTTKGDSRLRLKRDAAGFVAERLLEDGSRVQYRRDAFGRLIEVVDDRGGRTRLKRDALGRLTSVEDARANGAREEFEYDEQGRLVARRDGLGRETRFEHSPDGLLARTRDPRGVVTDLIYDAARRLERIEYRASAGELDPQETVLIEYDSLDRPSRVSDSSGSIDLQWSAFGELEVESVALAGEATSRITYTYDDTGKLTRRVGRLGNRNFSTVDYGYDDADRLETVEDAEVGVFSLVLDEAGRRLELQRPGDLLTAASYREGDGRLVSLETRIGAKTLARDTLTPDRLDLIARWLREGTLLLPASSESTYSYDRRGFLESVASDAPGVAQDYRPIDASGNARAATLEYDAAQQLKRDERFDYRYDEAGHLVERTDRTGQLPTRTFEWDLVGRLVRVQDDAAEILRLAYDPLGRLALMNERRLVSEGGQVLATAQGSDVETVWTRAPQGDEPWARRDFATGEILHLIANAAGHIVQWADAEGEIVQEISYDAFGQLIDSAAPLDEDAFWHGFGGRPYLAPAQLWDQRARLYDPALGRFLSREPLLSQVLSGPSPENGHPYLFGLGNPVSFGDPDGRNPLLILGGVVGGITGGVVAYNTGGNVAAGVFGGFVAGLIPGGFLAGTVEVAAGAGFFGNVSSQVLQSWLEKRPVSINLPSALLSAGAGALGAGVGIPYAVMGYEGAGVVVGGTVTGAVDLGLQGFVSNPQLSVPSSQIEQKLWELWYRGR